MRKTRLKINGMSCQHCVKTVTDALIALEGVQRVKVNLRKGEAVVRYDTSYITDANLVEAITAVGFKAVTKTQPLSLRLIGGILITLLSITGCSDMPYTGSMLTAEKVDQYITIGEDYACILTGHESACITLIPETEDGSRPIIHIYPNKLIYVFYYEGVQIMQAEMVMDTTEIMEQIRDPREDDQPPSGDDGVRDDSSDDDGDGTINGGTQKPNGGTQQPGDGSTPRADDGTQQPGDGGTQKPDDGTQQPGDGSTPRADDGTQQPGDGSTPRADGGNGDIQQPPPPSNDGNQNGGGNNGQGNNGQGNNGQGNNGQGNNGQGNNGQGNNEQGNNEQRNNGQGGNEQGNNEQGNNGQGNNEQGNNGQGNNGQGNNEQGNNGQGNNGQGNNGQGNNGQGNNEQGNNGQGNNEQGNNGQGNNGQGNNGQGNSQNNLVGDSDLSTHYYYRTKQPITGNGWLIHIYYPENYNGPRKLREDPEGYGFTVTLSGTEARIRDFAQTATGCYDNNKDGKYDKPCNKVIEPSNPSTYSVQIYIQTTETTLSFTVNWKPPYSHLTKTYTLNAAVNIAENTFDHTSQRDD